MIDLLNAAIGGLADAATALLALLPDSPATLTTVPDSHGLLGYAAYFLPLSELLTFLDALAAATLLWYAIRTVLRWAKMTAG